MSKNTKRKQPAPRVFRTDKRKVAFAIFLLLAFVGFGTFSLVAVEERAGDRVVGAVLMVLCLGMAGFLARDLKGDGTAVEVGPDGILDRRKRDGLIPWDRIAGAEIKRASIVRGIRLTLDDGKRIDIDTQMLSVDRKELMRIVAEEAHKAETRNARTERGG